LTSASRCFLSPHLISCTLLAWDGVAAAEYEDAVRERRVLDADADGTSEVSSTLEARFVIPFEWVVSSV
jgi:hypothetical protein